MIIGINSYKNASPLNYAVNDAKEFRKIIIEKLGFDEKNIEYLIDKDATKSAIQKSFDRFTENDIDYDERILVFFAGHGHTKNGSKGEVGFLVPYDAKMDKISSLIRWDEFTRNTDLIRAKHILFIMDACYGGLALQRSFGAGTTRYLKDMLLRNSRQVLTAGKADEVVSDSGGPLPNHSVFTGHLLEGLNGKAITEQGIITANGLMSYVLNKVGHDQNSNQTPHYGYFDGDGDFILNYPDLKHDPKIDRIEMDELVEIPATEEGDFRQSLEMKVANVKALISNDSSTIELHDYLVREVKSFLSRSTEDYFPDNTSFSIEELLERINNYEEISKDIAASLACVSHWGKTDHQSILKKILARMTDRLKLPQGNIWEDLRWYPIILLIYCQGVAAIAGNRFDSLYSLFSVRFTSSDYFEKDETLIQYVLEAIAKFGNINMFKLIPGYENLNTPMSIYVHKLLQPVIDDILFVGKSYDQIFDEFEVLLALISVDTRIQSKRMVWGPLGRFHWKYSNQRFGPLARYIEIAEKQKDNWELLRVGLFGGNSERFLEAAKQFKEKIGYF